MRYFQPHRDDPLRPGTGTNPRAQSAQLLLLSLLFSFRGRSNFVTFCVKIRTRALVNSQESPRILKEKSPKRNIINDL